MAAGSASPMARTAQYMSPPNCGRTTRASSSSRRLDPGGPGGALLVAHGRIGGLTSLTHRAAP
eukprot:10173567-Lingulodinium_polyedra.AAC.1